jgi:hypothetical protein
MKIFDCQFGFPTVKNCTNLGVDSRGGLLQKLLPIISERAQNLDFLRDRFVGVCNFGLLAVLSKYSSFSPPKSCDLADCALLVFRFGFSRPAAGHMA